MFHTRPASALARKQIYVHVFPYSLTYADDKYERQTKCDCETRPTVHTVLVNKDYLLSMRGNYLCVTLRPFPLSRPYCSAGVCECIIRGEE